MPTITVRNVPGYARKRLKGQGEAHNRSFDGEVLALLEQAVLGFAGEQRRVVLKKLKREQQRTLTWSVDGEEVKRAMREELS